MSEHLEMPLKAIARTYQHEGGWWIAVLACNHEQPVMGNRPSGPDWMRCRSCDLVPAAIANQRTAGSDSLPSPSLQKRSAR